MHALTLPFLTSILGLTTYASPLLSHRQAPLYPPHSQSTTFALVVNVTSPSSDVTPSVHNYVLTSYHVGAGKSVAVLLPNTTTTSARTFYENGTAEDVRYGRGTSASDGGIPPSPYGLALPSSSSVPSSITPNALSLSVGPGTPGIQLTQFPVPVSTLVAPNRGSYLACYDTSLRYGPTVTLTYAGSPGTMQPSRCVTIALLPQCEDDAGATPGQGEERNTVSCYVDVAGIDWNVYSAA